MLYIIEPKATLNIYKRKITDDCSPEIEVNDNFPQLLCATIYKKTFKSVKTQRETRVALLFKKILANLQHIFIHEK